MEKKQKFNEFKKYIIGGFVIFAIGLYIYHFFTVTTNERGFLGMDKAGRQILIQSMDYYAETQDQSITITSDWEDYSFIERLWQEPMRTTLRIYKETDKNEIFNSSDVEASLEVPYEDFLQLYDSEIHISEDYSLTNEELTKQAKEADVITFRDLLRGFGFVKYEYYVDGELKSSIILNPNITNHIEGNMVSTVGSLQNEPY